jgi:hypothetical protein
VSVQVSVQVKESVSIRTVTRLFIDGAKQKKSLPSFSSPFRLLRMHNCVGPVLLLLAISLDRSHLSHRAEVSSVRVTNINKSTHLRLSSSKLRSPPESIMTGSASPREKPTKQAQELGRVTPACCAHSRATVCHPSHSPSTSSVLPLAIHFLLILLWTA